MFRKRAWLTPDEPATEVFVCRRLLIPASMIEIVTGALVMLTRYYNFEEYGSMSRDRAADKMRAMFHEYLREDYVSMIGAIVPVVTKSVPPGALACDGAVYQRVDYPALYEVLDDVYIIDADSFQVPDFQGRALFGAGSGAGLTARDVGDAGGSETHQLTISEMPSHQHGYDQAVISDIDLEDIGIPQPSIALTVPGLTAAVGGNGAHENMPPFGVAQWAIIAVDGGCSGVGGALVGNLVTDVNNDYLTTVDGDPIWSLE